MPTSQAAEVQAIPILDLYAQYCTIQTEIDAAMARVVRASAFAGGPFVDTFERISGTCSWTRTRTRLKEFRGHVHGHIPGHVHGHVLGEYSSNLISIAFL